MRFHGVVLFLCILLGLPFISVQRNYNLNMQKREWLTEEPFDAVGIVWSQNATRLLHNVPLKVVELNDRSILALIYSFTDEWVQYFLNILCYNADGRLLWEHNIELAGFIEGAALVNLTGEGFLVAGGFYRYNMTRQFFALCFDNSGTLMWNFTTLWTGLWHIRDGCQVHNDTILLVGAYFNATLNYTPWVLKLDSSGNILWNRTYETHAPMSISSVLPLHSGEALLLGKSFDLLGTPSVIQIDNEGNVQWVKRYNAIHCTGFNDAILCSNGRLLFLGTYVDQFLGGSDGICLIQADRIGNIIWNVDYPYEVSAVKVMEIRPGTYLLCLNRWWSGVEFIRVDQPGDILWQSRNISGWIQINDAEMCQNGDVLILGLPDWYDAKLGRLRLHRAPAPPTLFPPLALPFTNSVSISWAESTDIDGYILGYEVEWQHESSSSEWDRSETIPALNWVSPPLRDGLNSFRVRAIDNLQSPSSWSNIIDVHLDFTRINQHLSWTIVFLFVGGAGISLAIITIFFIHLHTRRKWQPF